ncbi:MAG: R3H domain-containing nucleic acid-binding protein [Candidatus Roizmanbacteria bacterium]
MDRVAEIQSEAQMLLDKMIETFELQVEQDEHIFQIIIKTDDEASTIIGRHGETIRAIQKILEVVLYKKYGEPVNILVNVNDYREKQKERLTHIAGQLADKARLMQKPMHFRGLSSYERKLVHEFVTNDYSDLTTYSIGEGRDRHLVIDIKGNAMPDDASTDME